MKEYIKTTISREKLYSRNYVRDTIEEVIVDNEDKFNNYNYKTLISILTSKYLDSINE